MIFIAVIAALLYAASQAQKNAPGSQPTVTATTNAPSFSGVALPGSDLIKKILDLPGAFLSGLTGQRGNLGSPDIHASGTALGDAAQNQMIQVGQFQVSGSGPSVQNPPQVAVYGGSATGGSPGGGPVGGFGGASGGGGGTAGGSGRISSTF